MYEIDGICYAGKCDEGIKVSKVDVLIGGMMLVLIHWKYMVYMYFL